MIQQNKRTKILNKQQLAVSPKTLKLIEATVNRPKHIAKYMGIKFVINSGVFPFDSISHSSIAMADYLPNQRLNRVLDMGTGCGIQAVTAYMKGARSILAVDIDTKAVQNTRENIDRLGLGDKISVLKSDLFDSIPLEQFDTILAQLPFSNINYQIGTSHLFFDSNYKLHERFLSQAIRYLKQGGKIILAGGDLGDEKKLYALIEKYGYSIKDENTSIFNNVRWKIYAITANSQGGIRR